ncbi:hypothetical protein DACRYDRAFT_115786 [Dacryopinax primogenitus]|uniref:Myb-like domain-containing protein n=1 Tax=Dacryopinax primogenitus (strain DJM 731) TaxID=1858805 RepID=M5GA52_DACPD|nr:uncharacterized protein DACRYDRAFT_115786 [Dacryopinax primogenitus]EJU02822.1 hypothetical protein DACRYDRAFT_115786 [Dacryopinax primogenitus]
MDSRKDHTDTLPPFSPPINIIPLGTNTLPYDPFIPPPAQPNARYLTALSSLWPIAKQVIKIAKDTPVLEDGSIDLESSTAESWEEFGRILLHNKDGFYPLHKLDRELYFLALPSPELSEERYTAARQINVALLFALLFPTEATQLNSYAQWVTFLSQLKETYLLLCAGRGKAELLWVNLERISDICITLCLALEALDSKSSGLNAFRLVFNHSHLRHPQLVSGSKPVIPPSDLPRFESTWTTRALQDLRKFAKRPPKLEDAISTLRTGLLKDILNEVLPVLGNYAAASATPFPTPSKPIPAAKPKRTVPSDFAWNAKQTDAVRLEESSSFAEVVIELEEPVKSKRGRKGVKGKGRPRKGTRGRSGSIAGIETETEQEPELEQEQEEEVDLIVVEPPAPTIPTIPEEADDDESLPDVDQIIAETQLEVEAEATIVLTTQPLALNGKKRAGEESRSPTPRPAKKQAVLEPQAARPATQLPTPEPFFQERPAAATSSSPAPTETPRESARPPASAHQEDDDEVPEEEVEQEEEIDQLRYSVPVPTPHKQLSEPSSSKKAHTPPPKGGKQSKRQPTPPVQASGKKSSRYATGGNETGRKVWSTVEDNALMSALRELHEGSHTSMKWKTILDWHGSDGSKSTILKGRNNAQVKDRARNLYLKFQRNGQVPPVWLPER